MTMIRLAIAAAVLAGATAAGARDTLGIFDQWGAFRDARPRRCFAIAEPISNAGKTPWRPFISIAWWPDKAVRGQLQIRLSHQRDPASAVTLGIGDRKFALAGNAIDVWAVDHRMDAAIIAAIRSSERLIVASRNVNGRRFSDVYPLKGAATAMDAAAIGCARR